jgi:uncharacterized protein YjbI with pentapeptide repeats
VPVSWTFLYNDAKTTRFQLLRPRADELTWAMATKPTITRTGPGGNRGAMTTIPVRPPVVPLSFGTPQQGSFCSTLSGATLTGANLTGAQLSGADLTDAIWSDTTCPDGTNSDNDGDTCVNNLG